MILCQHGKDTNEKCDECTQVTEIKNKFDLRVHMNHCDDHDMVHIIFENPANGTRFLVMEVRPRMFELDDKFDEELRKLLSAHIARAFKITVVTEDKSEGSPEIPVNDSEIKH